MPSTDGTSTPMKPFHFADGQPKPELDENKENALHDSITANKQSKQPSHSPSKLPPSTPATRLPLADLLGDNEDGQYKRPNLDVSPEEQLRWQASRSPRSSNPKATPRNRGRKRAHSSTPPSTSQRNAQKKAKQQAALDLEELKKSLRTPQTDPATGLWNKYNVGIPRDTPLGRQLASLTTGITSSSPYASDEQTGNVGGLRRWTSCGMGFPSSKRKRRKVASGPNTEQLAQVFDEHPKDEDEEATVQPDTSATSRIGTLLQQISASLVRSKETETTNDDRGPSSSSPLPDRHEEFDRQSISPLRAPELAAGQQGSNYEDSNSIAAAARDAPSPSRDNASSPHATYELHTLTDAKILNESPMSNDMDILDDDVFDDDFEMSADDFDDVAAACTAQDRHTQSTSQAPNNIIRQSAGKAVDADPLIDDDGDDEDDIDEELFAAAEATATQSHSVSSRLKSSAKRRHRAIQRYLVRDVLESEYVADSGRTQMQKILSVQDEKTSALKSITLHDSWFDTRCTEGSYVHLIGSFDKRGHCIVDDVENMLILHPDHLVSALTVADSFSCMRKAVLQDRIKATSESSPPMLYGTILHEIFQEAMKTGRWDDEWFNETISDVVNRHVDDLYQTSLTVDAARIHLQGKVPELQAWANVFVKSRNEGMGPVKDRNGRLVQMNVNKLLDVEEHIWSPMYGLKGNIDATVQVTMEADDGGNARTLTVPLELKTGKRESASHRAQTALYTLLLSDRYDVAVAYGILYYIETSQTLRIPAIRHELRHMIMQRNELACYIRERLALPPMIRNTHTCTTCYAKEPCFIYHKLVEDGNGETSGLRDKFDALTKQLQPAHQHFFQKWNNLLTKEETEMLKFKRELWTMLSHERQKLGRCFANVTLITETAVEATGSSKINRFNYSFQKLNGDPDFSFTESQIAIGDPIVISDEKGHYALAKGYITSLTKARVEVAVDRRLHNARARLPGFHAEHNQVFAGITDSASRFSTQELSSQASSNGTQSKSLLYRIDKDEFANGMALVRANLVSIMSKDAFNGSKLRSLIVDGAKPSFRAQSTAYAISGPASQANVNSDQRSAIEKILSAEDYALVLGMPGTGKTTTIAHIIRALVAKGKSVLLTSYTHTAVDNILLKLKDDHIPILRLGTLAKIHPDVGTFASLAAEPRSTVEELEKLYNEPQVVGTTCLGVNHAIFQQRTFDYCIVDEASQITLPVCTGPIRLARAFVLVGDHYQLPPLVQNRQALEGGLDVSLFRNLCEEHPEAVVELGVQYRMNAEIMSLANTLVYGGKLKCGSGAVASRRLDMPRWDKFCQHSNSPSSSPSDTWLHQSLAPGSPPLVFLNTDMHQPKYHEHAYGARITNELEVRITVTLVRSLIAAGVGPDSIGVITLYRSQLALLKAELQTELGSVAKDVEAHTADRFQGRDKEVVVLSCVRSNDKQLVGDLLKDWRRVNVALTRARSKILIVGSRNTLSRGDELLGKMVDLFAQNGRILNIEDEWEFAVPPPSILPVNTSPARRAASSPIKNEKGSQKARIGPPRKPLAPLTASDANSQPQRQPCKQPLKPGQRPFKVPAKVGKGGLTIKKGPVLDDVMREILGDDNDF